MQTLQPVPQANIQTSSVAPGAAGARQSLKVMRQIVLVHRMNPLVVSYARQIVNNAGIRMKDYPAQAHAIYDWITQNIAFTRDPVGVDLYMTPEVTLHNGAGDCDDLAILFASFMESLGHPSGFLAIREPGSDTFNHVLAITRIGDRWICADCSNPDQGLGWCPPATQTMVQHI